MGKGKRSREKRQAAEARVSAAFSQKLPLAAPLAVPGAAPASLTQAELADALPAKAFKRELSKRLAKANEDFFMTELACILWALHKHAGWGKARLIKFVESYRPIIKELTDFYNYEYEETDAPFACVEALKKECGLDVAELRNMEM